MQVVELVAMLSGVVFTLSAPVAGLSCAPRPRRWLGPARPALAVAALVVVALGFVVGAAPPVEALAAVALGLTLFALALHLSTPSLPYSHWDAGSWTEPTWWASFEESFWRHVG